MIIRRTQPRTAVPPVTYRFASHAAALKSQGLTPKQVDAVHPRPAIKGASHSRTVLPAAAAARTAQAARNVLLHTGNKLGAATAGGGKGGAASSSGGGGHR